MRPMFETRLNLSRIQSVARIEGRIYGVCVVRGGFAADVRTNPVSDRWPCIGEHLLGSVNRR